MARVTWRWLRSVIAVAIPVKLVALALIAARTGAVSANCRWAARLPANVVMSARIFGSNGRRCGDQRAVTAARWPTRDSAPAQARWSPFDSDLLLEGELLEGDAAALDEAFTA